MQVSRETKILNTICIALVILSGLLRLALKKPGIFTYNHLIFTMFTAAAAIWIFQLKKRLLNKDVRRNLICAASLMIFWMAVRTLKYEFFPPGHFTVRYAWYSYYIPMIFIPLFMFFAVLSIGSPENKPVGRKRYFLFIPALVLSLGIITNDLHQRAFLFNDGIVFWNENNISRGFFYYAAMAWIAVLFVAMLAVVFMRCAVPGRHKMIWVPLIPLAVGAVYTVCIVLNKSRPLTKILTVPEIGCFVFAAFMESLICVRLFPNNDSYGMFWNASTIGAGIMDNDGNIRYKSEKSVFVTPRQVRRAKNETVYLNNGSLRLKSHAVRGGVGYWIRDISEINRLNDELKELGNITAEENSMLEAENKIKSELLRIEEQNRLYDDMAIGVRKQLNALSEILGSLPQDETDFENTMKYACILNAYIKRHSNLLLLSHQSEKTDVGELCCALAESLEYLKIYGINTYCAFNSEGSAQGSALLLAYEIFEAAVESAVPGADNILVYVNLSDGILTARMEINEPREIFSDSNMRKKAADAGAELETETDESAEFIMLTIPAGGETAS